MNNFMASSGLDVDLFEEKKTEKVFVQFGSIRGNLLSYTSGEKQILKFSTNDIATAFQNTKETTQTFRIKYNDDVYEFKLRPYNYKLEPRAFGVVVTVEEIDEKEE